MRKEITFTDQGLANLDALTLAVADENLAQLTKWKIQTMTLAEWITCLTEEVGELARAAADLHFGRTTGDEQIHEEAIHVATLALKITEMVKVATKRSGYHSLGYALAAGRPDQVWPHLGSKADCLATDLIAWAKGKRGVL